MTHFCKCNLEIRQSQASLTLFTLFTVVILLYLRDKLKIFQNDLFQYHNYLQSLIVSSKYKIQKIFPFSSDANLKKKYLNH